MLLADFIHGNVTVAPQTICSTTWISRGFWCYVIIMMMMMNDTWTSQLPCKAMPMGCHPFGMMGQTLNGEIMTLYQLPRRITS